jgi:arylsulfatase A-like enzyme
LLVVVAVLTTGCGGPTGKEGATWNLVVVTFDTTRADHVGHLGYSLGTTPRMDALARDGLAFSSAYSTSSWTAPSHASLFTGLYPTDHGCRAAVGTDSDVILGLGQERTTLAETCQAAGMATGAFVGGPALSHALGFSQGFDVYDDDFAGPQRSARATNEAAIPWLHEVGQSRFFLFLNYFDPHGPYEPDPSIDYPFGSQPVDVPAYTSFSPGVTKRDELPLPEDPAEIDRLIERYDQEIYAADRALGRLIDELTRMEILDRTLIVVTSDHGESFGETVGTVLWGHGLVPYQVQCHVPLVVRIPGQKRRRGVVVEETVSQVDLLASLTSLLGLSRPTGIPASDLLGRREAIAPGALCERYLTQGYCRAIVGQEFMMVRIVRPDPKRERETLLSLGPEPSLLPIRRITDKDTSLAPDLVEKARGILEDLRSIESRLTGRHGGLAPVLEPPDPAEMQPLSHEAEEKLRLLGYIK